MKKYIFLIIILLFSVLFLGGCINKKDDISDLQKIKDRGYLIVGVKTDSPPFGYYKDGKLCGIDVQIAQYIADGIFGFESPQNIKYVSVDAQNRIEKLSFKQVDILVATLSVNDKRKLVVDFSVPYFVASQKIMIPKESKIKSLSYFNKNGKVAVVMGSTGEKIVRIVTPNAYVIGAKTYYEALKLLKEGKVDAIFGDDCILQGLNNGKYKIINRAYSKEYYAVAVRKTKTSKDLLTEINSIIAYILDEKKLILVKKPLTF